MDLKTLQQKTRDVELQFPVQSSKTTIMLDQVEEVGELAQAMLIVEKLKLTNDPTKQKSIADIANGLGDVLYDLLSIANQYDLNMDLEYQQVLTELEARVKKGEFDPKT